MQLLPEMFVSLHDEQKTVPLHAFQQQRIHAVSGIGNPSRFFAMLRLLGMNVIEHVFKDHYVYRKQDIDFQDELPIIMTEKDAVKCKSFTRENIWYLRVSVTIDNMFAAALLDKLGKIRDKS
jgi:tetraacyldisaccharide 4'-kinase